MSTTADFYDGIGSTEVWLGSLQYDADPASVLAVPAGRLALTAADPITYADAVADLLHLWPEEGIGHAYHPSDGWPWPWPDSAHTDWTYLSRRPSLDQHMPSAHLTLDGALPQPPSGGDHNVVACRRTRHR